MTYYVYDTLRALSGLGFTGRINDQLLTRLPEILSENQLAQLDRLNGESEKHDDLFAIFDTWESETILDLMETIALNDLVEDDAHFNLPPNRMVALDLLLPVGITTLTDRERYSHVDQFGPGDAFDMLRDLRAAHECGVLVLAAGAL